MKLGLIGYGKMGRAIESMAEKNSHEIVFITDGKAIPEQALLELADVCIEFTGPESAFDNLKACIDAKVPVVSGTTGWVDRKKELESYCAENQGCFFYASNFSLGVNIFFTLNKELARIMGQLKQYQVSVEEIHHTQKKDAPSGTAISILESIIAETAMNHWHLGTEHQPEDSIPVSVKRIDPTPGTHRVNYASPIDQIEIKHVAHSREGFVQGALMAAQWCIGKRGNFGMNDLLTL